MRPAGCRAYIVAKEISASVIRYAYNSKLLTLLSLDCVQPLSTMRMTLVPEANVSGCRYRSVDRIPLLVVAALLPLAFSSCVRLGFGFDLPVECRTSNPDACPSSQRITVFYRDRDGDTFGDGTAYRCLCTAAEDYTAVIAGDCDDANATVHPAQETAVQDDCDGIDNDCDGTNDEDAIPPAALVQQEGVCAGANKRCLDGVWVEPDYAIAAVRSFQARDSLRWARQRL